jgi:hypothetical protein
LGVVLGFPAQSPAQSPVSAGGINHSWAWVSTDLSPTDHYAEHIDCPYSHGGNGGTSDQEGGLSTTDALGLSSGAPPESSAAWTATAPSNTTFAAITYERYLGHEDDTSNTWSPALRADGTIVTGQTCTVMLPSVGCFLGGPPGEGGEPTTITGLTAHELALRPDLYGSHRARMRDRGNRTSNSHSTRPRDLDTHNMANRRRRQQQPHHRRKHNTQRPCSQHNQ